jgi:COMPASS component SWD1
MLVARADPVSDPFAQNYPEGVDCTLPSTAQRCKFNPSGPYAGHYIATGGGEGLVEIWDLDTKGVIRTFEGHVRAVSGLRSVRLNRFVHSI